MSGEEARVSNTPVFIDHCSWVCAHLAFVGGQNVARRRIQHLITNKYIPLVSCDSNLFTSWHCLLKYQ